jgi:hypothetical protein
MGVKLGPSDFASNSGDGSENIRTGVELGRIRVLNLSEVGLEYFHHSRVRRFRGERNMQ